MKNLMEELFDRKLKVAEGIKNKILSVKVVKDPDEDPDPSYLDQEEFKDRKAEYEAEKFSFIGIHAEAEVVIHGVVQTIRSGGLYGIEDDSGVEYFNEVAQQELNDLAVILQDMGFSKEDVDAAFKNVSMF